MDGRREFSYLSLVPVVAALVTMTSMASAHNGRMALALPVSGITIDGDFSDWPESMATQAIALAEHGDKPLDDADFQGHFRVGYNVEENALYIAVEVRDQSMVVGTEGEAGDWNTHDGCEIYVHPLHHEPQAPAMQLAFYGGARRGSRGEEGANTAVGVRRTTTSHRYEWRVDIGSLSEGQVALGPQMRIGIDLVVTDKDADGSFSWVAWGPGTGKTSSADRRGDVALVESYDDAGMVSGTVTSKTTGKSYPGLIVEAFDGGQPAGSIQTDADGRFSLPVLPGEYTLRPATGQGAETVEVGVVVEAGQTVAAELTISPPGFIVGRVSEEEGGGHYAGLLIEAFADGQQVDQAQTNERGEFRFARLPAGSYDLRPGGGQGLEPFTVSGLEVRSDKETVADFSVVPVPYLVRLVIDLPTGAESTAVSGQTVDDILATHGLSPAAEATSIPGPRFRRMYEVQSLTGLSEVSQALGQDPGWQQFAKDLEQALVEAGTGGAIHHDFKLVSGTAGSGSAASAGEGEVSSAEPTTTAAIEIGDSGTDVFADTELYNVEIHALARTADGSIWLATGGRGLWRYDGSTLENFTTESGLPHNWVRALLADEEGYLWIGTDGAGLCRYDGDQFTTWTRSDGLPHDSITSLIEDGQGGVWIGTEGGGVAQFDGESITTYTTQDGLPGDWITSLMRDEEGGLWIGTEGEGVCRIKDGRFSILTRNDGLGHNWISALLQDSDGRIWVGTLDGVSYLDGAGGVETLSTDDGLSHAWVSALVEDADGHLWIGMEGGGTNSYDGQRLNDGIGEIDGLIDNRVSSLLLEESALWMGTQRGVSRHK